MQPLVSVATLAEKKYFSTWFGKQEVMAVQTSDGVRVYSGMCPHQGGPLIEGKFEPDAVTCPWHGCRFDLKTGTCVDYGACINLSGMGMKSLPFEIKEGMVYVQLGE